MAFPVTVENARPVRRLRTLMIALLFVAVLWTGREIPEFGYATLMDDDTNILFNSQLGELNAARLRWMFTDIEYVARYLPLGWLSFSLVRDEVALSPWGCHVAGVVFHALNAVLVFLCLGRLVGHFSRESNPADRVLAAGFGALLWAVHPLRVEPAAWCSGLLYLQGGFFALLTVYARLRELEARAADGRQARSWLVLGLIAFACSLLTYPVALFLPALLWLLDFAWGKKTTAARFATTHRRWLGYGLVCLVLLSVAELLITVSARSVLIPNGLPPPNLTEFGLGARAVQAVYVWASYVWRTLWPVELTPVMEALFEIRLSDFRIWASGPTLLAISLLAWRWRRIAPFFGLCWVGYLFWMIPFLGLNEHPHTASDRYSYLVSVLFSLGLALAWLRVPSKSFRGILLGITAMVTIGLALLFVRQARIWRDAMTTHRYVFRQLRDEDLRNITLSRIAKLQFLAGNVRDGRALAQNVYAAAPQIAGVARTWREVAPTQPLSDEVALRPLQEWVAAPTAYLHHNIAREHLADARWQDALSHLNVALQQAPEWVELRYRRALVLAALGEFRGAIHDWLVLELNNRGNVQPAGVQFAAEQIAAACDRAGEERLARGLRQRAASGATTGRIPLPVR